MRTNRYDAWLRFCELHHDSLVATGIPTVISNSETKLRELLELGFTRIGTIEIALSDLTATQWASLEQFAKTFFEEFESYSPLDLFPAFRLQVEQRGTGFHG